MVETSSPLRVVLVEDNKNDRFLFREAFQKSDVSCDIAECARAEEALELLGADASSFDVVAVGLNLPGISGMDLCRKLLDNKTPLPLVLLTETGSERLAAEALRAGVHDYIIKDPKGGYLELLPMSLINTARRHVDRYSYKRTEQALQDSEKAAEAFLDAIPDTAVLIDTKKNVLTMNKAGADRLGRSLDEIIGRNVRELFPEDVYELRQSKAMEVIRTGKMVSYEDERDGICFETWICPIFDTQGEVERLAIFAHDVTDRKQTEKELRDSKYLLEKTFSSLDSAVFVLDNGNPPRIVDCNPATLDMFGYPKSRIIGQTADILHVNVDSLLEFQKTLYPAIETHGHLSSFEFRMKRRNGRIFPTEHYIRPLKNDNGDRIGWVSIVSDITERKKLRDRDEIILKTCIDGFWVIDPNGRILEVNDAYCRMSGYIRDELLTMSVQDLEAAETPHETLQHIRGIMEIGYHRFQSRQKRKDGTIMDLDISANYLELDGGRIFTFFRDITESNNAAEALKESEARYRTLVEQLPAVTYMASLDEASTTLYVSPQVKELLGFTIEEYKSDPDMWRKRLHPDDRDRVLKTVSRSHAEKKPFVDEYRMIAKNGNIVWFRDEGVIVKDEKNQPLLLQGVMYNITEHKSAEEALQESELRYRTLFETLPVGVGLAAIDGRIIDANSTMLQMIGSSLEEIKQSNVRDTYHNTNKRTRLLKQLQQDGFVRDFQAELKRKDGSTYYSNLNVTAMKIRGETVLVTVAKDITEQRKLERSLAESEEKYRTLVESAGDPISTIDERGVFLFANKVAAETLGYQPEDMVGKTLWDFFPKEMADQSAANIRKVIETGQRIKTVALREVQGQTRWYSATIEPLRDDHGSVTAAMVIVRDIDDMKRAEEQIKKLSSALESSINGIAIGNIEGNLTYVNNSFLKMWDYENQSEVLGRNASQFWKVNDKAAEIEDALRNGEGWIGELTAVRKDGSQFDIQVCQTSIKGENGRIVSLMGSFVDISESKRKEEELLKYRGQMARAEQLASLGTLSATVAHQLTQPLTVIRLSMDNALDELEATSSSETVIRRLKDSVTQVSNITSIVDRFRNFARKSSGRTVAEVDMKAVAVRIARLLSESARSVGIALRLGNMGGLPCPWMNETDLEQLFFALIENAIQAANGKKGRQLVISGSVKHDYIELRFSDNCGGISPENLDKIFEPFFTTKPRGQGTGLGLCIVQDVASRTGGHVRIENKFGKGTTFIISLPVDQGKIS